MSKFLFISLLAHSFLFQEQERAFKKVLKLMGSRFEITVIGTDEKLANIQIDSAIDEINRIEKIISSWDEESQTSEINRNAGIRPVKVDYELFQLIERSQKVSELTDGAFDISFASIDRLWKFDGSMKEFPDSTKVKTSVSKIDYRNIMLNETDTSVFLKEKGMKIGFGAIGKGYAAQQAKAVLVEMGVKSGCVNASGDLVFWGKQVDGNNWKIGISNPANPDIPMGWLSLEESAVVTSGDYEKYIEIDRERYAHIIDPKTGYPTKGIRSVTIVCPNAELADALATSVFVLGKKKGLELINQLKGIEGLIITEDGQLHSSVNLNFEYHAQADY